MRPQPVLRAISFLDLLGKVTGWIAMLLILVMIGSMAYEVISRKIFGVPTIWALTVSYMFNGTLFLLGAAYTLRANQHVRIDFLSSRLPVRIQHGINAAFYLFALIPALWLTTEFAYTKAMRAYARGTLEAMSAWEPILWPFLTGITIGLAAFLIQIILETIRHLLGLRWPAEVTGPSVREEFIEP
ncbi:MAG: TRAP transporter small permease subunit [Pseudomonadota bacterium]